MMRAFRTIIRLAGIAALEAGPGVAALAVLAFYAPWQATAALAGSAVAAQAIHRRSGLPSFAEAVRRVQVPAALAFSTWAAGILLTKPRSIRARVLRAAVRVAACAAARRERAEDTKQGRSSSAPTARTTLLHAANRGRSGAGDN